MRGTRRSLARRVRNIAVALLPAVVVVSMFVLERPAAASSTAVTTETTSPDIYLVITKAADASPVVAGNQIGFTITLQHSGAFAVSDVSLTDTLPTTPGTSWSIDTGSTTGWGSTCAISAGGVLTCGGTGTTFNNSDSAVVHIVSDTTLATCDPAISTIVNTASYYGTPDAGGPVSDSSTASLLVTCPLTLTKVADAPSVTAGNNIGFTITATNAGTSSIGPVIIDDPVPANAGLAWTIAHQDGTACDDPILAGTLHCAIPTLAAGHSYSVHIVSPTTSDTCGTVDNTATAGLGLDGDARNDIAQVGSEETSAEATINVSCLTLTKVAEDASVSAGDTIGFTITVKNLGSSSIGPVVINDTVPTNAGLVWTIASQTAAACADPIVGGNLHCEISSLAGGATYSVHITSPTTTDTCGTVDNTATAQLGVVGAGADPASPFVQVIPAPLSAEATVTVQCANLSITKTPDLYRGVPGKKMSWTITVENHGPGTAHDVVMSDLLHFGGPYSVDDTNHCYIHLSPDVLVCEFGDMAPGASFTVHLTAVLSSLSDCGEIRNVAGVEAINEPLVFSSPAITTVKCPNVSVVKTTDYGTVSKPSRGFDIVVSSSGTAPVENVKLSDPLVTGATWSIVGGNGKSKCHIKNHKLTCSFGTMAPGKSFTVHIKVVQKICSSVTNTATVSTSNEPSFELGDNTSTAVVGCVI
jgi:uncharacterized repeat protein (TIGR01451 family)